MRSLRLRPLSHHRSWKDLKSKMMIISDPAPQVDISSVRLSQHHIDKASKNNMGLTSDLHEPHRVSREYQQGVQGETTRKYLVKHTQQYSDIFPSDYGWERLRGHDLNDLLFLWNLQGNPHEHIWGHITNFSLLRGRTSKYPWYPWVGIWRIPTQDILSEPNRGTRGTSLKMHSWVLSFFIWPSLDPWGTPCEFQNFPRLFNASTLGVL